MLGLESLHTLQVLIFIFPFCEVLKIEVFRVGYIHIIMILENISCIILAHLHEVQGELL